MNEARFQESLHCSTWQSKHWHREVEPVAFLLGSGVSWGAGLDGTEQLTRAVLTPEASLNPPQALRDRDPLTLLALLKSTLETYYERVDGVQRANYEDLYYMASQIVDSELGEFDNPALDPFILDLLRNSHLRSSLHRDPLGDDDETPPISTGPVDETELRRRLRLLAERALEHVERTIRHRLSKADVDLRALHVLGDASEAGLPRLTLFTLNHDTLVERHLQARGVLFEDGFSVVDGDLRFFSPHAFECSPLNVHLLKLHGSLDWHCFRCRDEYGEMAPLGKAQDPWHAKDSRGREWIREHDRPLLIGTFNKMLSQVRGDSFMDLLCLFRLGLRSCRRLVISGYGYGDKGINGVLLEWLAQPGNRAVWIDPQPQQTIERGRPAAEAIARAEARGQLEVWARPFAESSWVELKKALS